MPLTETDFLRWYNEEITRYRNIEWRVAGYSIAFSYATLLFASSPATRTLVPYRALLALVVALFAVCLLAAELHIHARLNDYRAMRSAFLDGTSDHSKVKGCIWRKAGRLDHAYLVAFLLFPAAIATLTVVLLLSGTP